MPKFILLYNGPATDMSDMDPEEAEEVMSKWRDWMDGVGEALVDIGAPMTNGIALKDDGTDGLVTELSGYSIIEADDIDEAKELIEDHPFLSENEGRFAVEIHEMLPTPGF